MRIDAPNGVIEIGGIYWSRRSRANARGDRRRSYLTAATVFDDLGYHRFEWKCDESQRAQQAGGGALRLYLRGHFPPAHGDQGREPRIPPGSRCSMASGRLERPNSSVGSIRAISMPRARSRHRSDQGIARD